MGPILVDFVLQNDPPKLWGVLIFDVLKLIFLGVLFWCCLGSPPRGPKRRPRGPKTPPRARQEAPRGSQQRPRTPQEEPKRPQEPVKGQVGSKTCLASISLSKTSILLSYYEFQYRSAFWEPKMAPKTAQDRPKTVPRGS